MLLINGYKSYQGPLAGLMDSPMLMMHLLFMLLQEAEPSGPSAVSNTFKPEITEPVEPIMLDSGIAYGAFPAPWSLSGTITPASDGQFRYQLRFTFEHQDGPKQLIQLSGLLDYSERSFPVDDSTSLDGWSAAWLDLKNENYKGLTPGLTLGKFKREMGSE